MQDAPFVHYVVMPFHNRAPNNGQTQFVKADNRADFCYNKNPSLDLWMANSPKMEQSLKPKPKPGWKNTLSQYISIIVLFL